MSYNFNTYPTEWGEVAKLKHWAEKESVQMKPDEGKTKYVGVYNYHHIVGFAGWMVVGKKIRYKSAYVFHNFRGKGLYRMLWDHRERVVSEYMKQHGMKEITAYCTKYSLPMFLKNGFKKESVNANGMTFVRKNIE
jgi:hypothetical protein